MSRVQGRDWNGFTDGRLAQRAAIGLARVGGMGYNGSGDIFLAIATGNHLTSETHKPYTLQMLPSDQLNGLFLGVADDEPGSCAGDAGDASGGGGGRRVGGGLGCWGDGAGAEVAGLAPTLNPSPIKREGLSQLGGSLADTRRNCVDCANNLRDCAKRKASVGAVLGANTGDICVCAQKVFFPQKLGGSSVRAQWVMRRE